MFLRQGVVHVFAYISSLSLWYIINQLHASVSLNTTASSHIYPAWEHVEKWANGGLFIHLCQSLSWVPHILPLVVDIQWKDNGLFLHFPVSEWYSEWISNISFTCTSYFIRFPVFLEGAQRCCARQLDYCNIVFGINRSFPGNGVPLWI